MDEPLFATPNVHPLNPQFRRPGNFPHLEWKRSDWVEEIFIQNEALVGGKINLLAQNDPYWHQVNLFYLQMEGLKNGLKLRADEDPRCGSTGCEVSTKRI